MKNIAFSFPEGKRKALTMSYDDGQIHDRRLVSIFNKYGIKGTFHLNSGKFDSDPFLSSSEVKDLFKGHEVSVHTLTHPVMTQIPYEEIIREVQEDRKNLETLAGYPVRGMSYPYGVYSDEIVSMLPLLGIEYSRTIVSTRSFSIPTNFLTWHPTCHHNDKLLERCKEFQNLRLWMPMALFYVWGHSFEFEWNNNWDLIEEFCKTIAFDESIWYATNIEIVDYIKALKNLKFSVDRRLVQNVSAIPVWIRVDGDPVKVEPGQTMAL